LIPAQHEPARFFNVKGFHQHIDVFPAPIASANFGHAPLAVVAFDQAKPVSTWATTTANAAVENVLMRTALRQLNAGLRAI